jgi:proline iminopeptidase
MSHFFSLDSNKVRLTEDSLVVKEGFIEVIGGKVWFKVEGFDKNAIPFLLLSGGPGGSHDSLEPYENLKKDRPVIFYDQLGCGNSDRSDDKSLWTIERFVEEVEQVTNALGLKKVHLFGHSWGSMLAAAYILKYGQKVTSCTLSGPFLSAPMFIKDARYYVSQLPENYRDVIFMCEETGNFNNKEYDEAMNYFDRQHVRRLDIVPDCVLRGRPKFGTEVYNHMWGPSEFTAIGTLKNASLIERLHEIIVPVLFMSGRYDEVRPETVEFYMSKIPDAEMKIIEDASHCTYNEKPEEVVNIVREFLEKIEKRS